VVLLVGLLVLVLVFGDARARDSPPFADRS